MGLTARAGANLNSKKVKIMYSFVGLTKVPLGLVSINPIAMDYLNSKKVKIRFKLRRVDQGPAGPAK